MVEEKNVYTVADLYKSVKSVLKAGSIPAYDHESRIILSCVLGEDPVIVYAHPEKPVEEDQIQVALGMARNRVKGMPLQYLTHVAYFMGFEFEVNKSVLIPRPDTEILVEKALDIIKEKRFFDVLDMGTGSGCIAISLARLESFCTVDAVDISKDALETAKKNAIRHGVADRIRFIQGDLFSGLSKRYHMIVSNPPYIKTGEYETLQREVRCYEPVTALVADKEGMAFYHRISEEAGRFLENGGYLLFETGYDQASAVAQTMERFGFTVLEVTKDFNGIDRVVSGRKSS